jgi:hypothetical protein
MFGLLGSGVLDSLTAMILSAATTVSGLPELPTAAQYGILGVLLAALVSGRFVIPRYVLDRERERADRMEQENVRLNALIQEKTIPAIVDASVAVRDSTLLVHDMKRERELQREIDRREDRRKD